MKIKKERDDTLRSIILEVEAGDVLEGKAYRMSNRYRADKVTFTPEEIKIQVADGELYSVWIGGPIVLKNGTPGVRRDYASWYDYNFNEAPGWLRQTVDEAIMGVTEWMR